MTELNSALQATMAPETSGPLSTAREALGGFAGKIAGSFRTGYETLQEAPLRYKVLIGAGLASLALSGQAEAATTNPDSVALGGNVPALIGGQTLLGNQEDLGSDQASISMAKTAQASAVSTGASLEQECVKAGLAAPSVVQQPTMYDAGIRPSQQRTSQRLRGKFEYPALESPLTSGDCAPRWARVIGAKFFMEKADVHGNPGNPIKNPANWTDITFMWGALGGFRGNQAGTNKITHIFEPQPSGFFNKCIDGKFLKVDYVERDIVNDTETKQKAGEAYHVLKTRVSGNCKAAATSARIATNAKN